MKQDNLTGDNLLRQKAEELLKRRESKFGLKLSEAETRELIHELEVHQIELEMMNEELVLARDKAQLAAEKAESAEQKNTELYDFAPSGYFTLSKVGDIIWLNLRGAEMLWKERSRLINNRFGLFVTDDTRSIFSLFLKKVFAGKSAEVCEVCISANEDILIYVQLTGIRAENKEQCRVTAMDITRRKVIEEVLYESKEKYRAIINTSPDAIGLFDIDANITMMNPAAAKIFGYETPGEMIGKNVFEFILPEDRERAGEIVKQIFTDKIVLNREFRQLRKNGTVFISESNFASLYAEDGKPNGILAVTRDITERIKAQEQIKILHKAVEYAPYSILIANKEENMEYVNPKFCDITGYSKEEVLGRHPRILKSENTPPEIYAEVRACISSGKEWTGQFQNQKKTGELYWESGSISPILDSKGNITHFIAVSEDITERRQKEEEIIRINSELNRVNSEKDKFFSIIAHDLRSPFTGILGITEIMASDDGELSLEGYANLSKPLRKSVENVYKLLENLLEWAMFQKGTIDYSPAELSLSDMLSHNIDSIKERARQKEITIISETSNVKKIFADENMINSIHRNLLSNAVKFTNRGGQVTVSAKETGEGMIEISVSDTGVGIPKDVIDKLFILGEKVGSIGTEREPSTGLGLILCKEFVEKHRGKIWVESEEGVGSKFSFTIPELIVNG